MAVASTSHRRAISRIGLRSSGLRVGCVDHGEAADLEALVNDGVKQVEGCCGDGLVGLVVADKGSTLVARHDLSGGEVLAGERRLARAGCAAENYEPDLGDLDASDQASHTNRLIGETPPSASAARGQRRRGRRR